MRFACVQTSRQQCLVILQYLQLRGKLNLSGVWCLVSGVCPMPDARCYVDGQSSRGVFDRAKQRLDKPHAA